LFTAVGRDDDRTVVSLVNGGLDPNVRRGDGQTALHVALRDESPKVIQALLALPKVDVNALNASGESPLMMAALRGNVPAAEALLARGARVHQDGWSPLHYAATGPEPKLVTLLIARGAQIESLSPNKTTPLMMAARYGDERNVDVLLAARANVKARNDKDLTAADFALLAGREKLAARLKP
jgi:ankyrin repeat protein